MRILLVQTGFLGDVILSTAVITNLRTLYPEAELSVLTTPLAADLVRCHPDISETLVFDKRGAQRGVSGLRAMAADLRPRSFDMVFSLHKSWRTAALLRLARIPVRYGFTEAAATWLYTRTAHRSDLEHEVLRNLAIFRNVDKEPDELSQELHLEIPPEADAEAAEKLGEAAQKPLIGLSPGSVWPTKRWTAGGYTKVAEEFYNLDYEVVLLGGASDAAVAKAVEDRSGFPMRNLVGKTSLLVSAAIIRRLELLISNDSAPLHVASAVKTPVVAVFCATVPEFGYGPWQVLGETVGVNDLFCRPCGSHGGKCCPTGTHACQLNLPVDEVTAAARRVLTAAKAERCKESVHVQ